MLRHQPMYKIAQLRQCEGLWGTFLLTHASPPFDRWEHERLRAMLGWHYRVQRSARACE
uniref:Uncharacterized protein n=1 Tax=Ralstonia solanacearum TaxID=305 RepID=A0A0S4UXT6_RALSL|nr:protein of unknown function [Ralstonia solanacearum]